MSFPPPPEAMMQQSDEWAFEQYVDSVSSQLAGHMQDTYYKGFTIYQYHLRTLMQRIEEAGGIAEVHYIDDPNFEHRGSPYRNELVCADGTKIGLSEVVAMPKLTQELPVPSGLPDTATRTHEIQLSYGGKYIHGNSEDVFDLERQWFPDRTNRPFEVILQDPTYFPEDMGITERIVIDTNKPFDRDYPIEDPHVVKQSFSLDGKIWRPHLVFDDSEDIPNPYTNPLGYRRWALSGDAKLELEFQAPAIVRSRNSFDEKKASKRMKTVIEHTGRINVDGCKSTRRDVVDQFQHYMELMDFCYVEYLPEEERAAIDQEIDQRSQPPIAELSSGNKAPEKKKSKK